MPIQQAGALLLKTLAEKKSVRYSYFYNASEESEAMLMEAGVTELEPDEVGDDEEEPNTETAAWLIDEAVQQLKDAGYLVTVTLREKLIDDEPDYLISLSPKGQELIKSGAKFRYVEPGE